VPKQAERPKSDEPASWLKAEFARTALPYSGLAEYLGLDKSAVTKVLAGDRRLRGDEIGAAQAYFTVVSQRNGARYRDVLEKLQSARTRKSIVSQLHEWLKANEPPWTSGISFTRLIENSIGPNATLRADQLMALCRVLKINIDALVDNGGVQLNPDSLWEPTTKDAIEELSVAATEWASEARVNSTYQFNRGRSSKVSTQSSGRAAGLIVRKGPRADSEFESCEPFVIDGDGAEPIFRKGQTVYVQYRPDDLKSGDVVIVFTEVADVSTATIGFFQFETSGGISIDIPNRGRANIPTSQQHLVGRVNFSRL
jgi:hypothetical protein